MDDSDWEGEGEAQDADEDDDDLRAQLARLPPQRVHDGAVPETMIFRNIRKEKNGSLLR